MAARSSQLARTQNNLFWLASILFFISGGTGLVYQVIWFKRFAHLWGSSSLAFAAVGGSFLFGLGLGAYLIGRRADAVASPLRWYGICELLIGLLALATPLEIAALVNASVGLYEQIPEQPLARYVVQFLITLLVIGPPCILMGGTLPLLIRQLTARDGSLDQATGWLYAINTFGGAAGCYLAGFHFLPTLGMISTNNMTATVNILIGLVSLAASGISRQVVLPQRQPKATAATSDAAWNPRLAALYVAAALSGCAALVLEMTWSRQLALVLGGSTYAYTATLFVVLVGIATGSLLFHTVLRKWASSPWLSIAVIGLMVGSVVAGTLLLPQLSQWLAPAGVREWRGDQFWNGAICAGASAVVELLPAIGMGVLFPLFVHLTQASAAQVGETVGKVYAWNTAGSILGATFTAVVLFPWLGTAGSTALALGMYVVSLLAMLPWQGSGSLLRLGISAAIGAAAVVLVAQPIDPRDTNLGLYLYGNVAPGWRDANEVLFFDEGASCNVLVTRAPVNTTSLRVNGKVDASNSVDMATQIGLAYLPRLFKADAKDVLVIGFGSGCTSGHSLQFPDTRVTCCELEPAVYAAAKHFELVNRRPHEQTREWLEARNKALPPGERLSPEEIDRRARFSIVFGDGRTTIQASDKKYDLIISEPSNPWVAGCSNLFTKEFFRAAKQRLAPGGVLAQWIQTYNFTLEDYLLIVRTMQSEFPYYGILSLAAEGDTLLLASNEPLLPNPQRIAKLQTVVDANPQIRADLHAWFGQTELRWLLLNHYLLGKEQLDRIVDKSPSQVLNTDQNLRLEFNAPLRIFGKNDPETLAMKALPKAGEPTRARWVTQLATAMNLPSGTAECYVKLGNNSLRQASSLECSTSQRGSVYLGCLQQAVNWYAMAQALEPKNTGAGVGIQRAKLMADEKTDRIKILEQLVELDPTDAESLALLGEHMGRGQHHEAVKYYLAALALRPDLSYSTRNYLWANNLAWTLATSPNPEVRNGAEAVRWARAAQAAAGDYDWQVLDTLAAALAESGDFSEAIEVSEELLKRFSEQPELVADAKKRLELYHASQPFHESN
jgi:predicted membrane-bound spermidine synthase/tetratricopeptide (TPR) repeat protein